MKVGIIIIFYNNEKDIDISLLSEQLNNCINIDFCFINNSSNDGTYHVLSEIKQVSKSNISIVDIKKHVSEQLAIKAGVRYMSNYFQINHFGFLNMEALRNDSKKIQEIIIDVNNNRGSETRHVTTVDIQNLNPCSFPSKENPITKKKCQEAFSNMKTKRSTIPDDFLVKLFYGSLGIMGIYLLIALMKRIQERK